MKLEGSYSFQAPRQLVWEMLQDPEVLARIMPGCEKLERVGENEFEGKLKVKMGPVQSDFQGRVTLGDLQPPYGYEMGVVGHGPAGNVDGTGRIQLSESDGTTTMAYQGNVNVSGRIATVGQRLMESSAKAITKQSLEALEQQIQHRLQLSQPEPEPQPQVQTTPAASAPPPLPPPTQTEFALGVAKNLYEEMVPAGTRQFLTANAPLILAITAGIILLINWWTNLLARRIARYLRK